MEKSELKQLIKDYIKIDDEITMINNQVRDLRKKRTNYEGTIKDFMINNSIATVDLPSGSLKISTSKQHKKINKKIILDTLLNHLSDDQDKANDIYEELFNEDDSDDITKLERMKMKKN